MNMLLPTTIFLVILGLSSAVPQLGIKTRQPPQSGNLVHNNTAPVYSHSGDRQYDFMNRSRTDMASGICFKEVPTVTLAESEGHAGNGVCILIWSHKNILLTNLITVRSIFKSDSSLLYWI